MTLVLKINCDIKVKSNYDQSLKIILRPYNWGQPTTFLMSIRNIMVQNLTMTRIPTWPREILLFKVKMTFFNM